MCTDVSDHFSVFCIISQTSIQEKVPTISKRNFNGKNIDIFKNCLLNHNWDSVLSCNEAQRAFSVLQGVIDQLIEQIFPEQTFTVNYRNRHEWMTPELRMAITKRNTMANISKQNPDNSDLHNEYKKFRNDLTSALRNAQLEHHSKELDLTKHDVSKTWGVLRQIIGLTGTKVSKNLKFDYNNKIISDDTEIANAFNNFFASIDTELASKITSTLNPMTYISNIENSIFVPDVTENDVWNVIAQLKNSSAGWNHFPAIVAKQCINGYITPLTHVINLSLIQEVFPSELKLARVVPIYNKMYARRTRSFFRNKNAI